MSRNLDTVPIEELEYQELISAATWEVISGITRGEALRSSVSTALQLALAWNKSRTDKKPSK